MGHGVYTRCGGIARLSRTEVSRLRGIHSALVLQVELAGMGLADVRLEPRRTATEHSEARMRERIV
jgi:hypothetical protein